MVFADAIETTKFKYFTVHALIIPFKMPKMPMQIIIFTRVYIRYHHVLKWLCVSSY